MFRPRAFMALIVACAAFLVPAGAQAASVVNGGFEAGSFNGWQTYNSNPGCGGWFLYTEPQFFPPPEGEWAAFTQQDCGITSILYQDVNLEPGYKHELSMFVYYASAVSIQVPSPNSLDDEVSGNQQMRVDVMRPSAPIESVEPGDILATVFANKNGDPTEMGPTRFTTDLSAFAGQTVRLRAAVVAGELFFGGAIDGASITSTALPAPPPPPPPSNLISRGKLTLNKKKGTGKLAISVPGPGTLAVVAKGSSKKIRNASLTVAAAGIVKVPLNPTGKGRKVLNANGRLKNRLAVTFTPTGGAANTQIYKVTLKKTLKPKAPKK